MRTPRGRALACANQKRHLDRLRAKAKASDLIQADPAQADVLRRVLVEEPPKLDSEEATLAYFRGFVAGAKRSSEEGQRFERLKDLCHRIAADHGRHYEERVSAAYEALLSFLRRSHWRTYESVEAERKEAAAAIRSGIIDRLRQTGERTRGGAIRYPRTTLTDLEKPDTHSDVLHPVSVDSRDELEDILKAVPEMSEREREAVRWLARGFNLKEIGTGLGVTESAVCRMVQRIGEKHPELEQLLAG